MLFAGCEANQDRGCRSRLADELPSPGHRNWIVVADSAYPAQTSPGLETVVSGADHVEVVSAVLEAVDRARHIQAKIYLDAELDYVSQSDAPQIDAYQRKLKTLLAGRKVESVPHEELIARLDKAARVFRVLILKTNLTLPYTSVFVELDCGYWGPEAEQRMRQAMRN
jgi:L-fucose mutarotase/ribose pyranase (RbsD/FucU family)